MTSTHPTRGDKRATRVTQRTTQLTAHTSYVRDRTVLPCGMLHNAVQLFELHCSYTIHKQCSVGIVPKKNTKTTPGIWGVIL